MPSPQLELVLTALRRTSGSELDLRPYQLSERDWAELSGQASELQSVTVLRVGSASAGLVVTLAAGLPSLRQLDVKLFSDEDIRLVADTLTDLTSLDLDGCDKVTDAGVKTVADKLTALTSLDLAFCDKVTDAGVKTVADKLTALTSLNLAFCDKVTDAGVKAVADKLTALTTFGLAGCNLVTDAGVQAVADKLTALTSLNLSRCQLVTDVGVKAVTDKLTALTSLNLSWCVKVTDTGVKAVADKLTALTSLNLSWCVKVTDTGVKTIADKLTALIYLDLDNTPLLTDAGVQPIAEKLTRLTYLSLYGRASGFTDAGVRNIAGNLSQLTSLRLRGCTRLTDMGVTAIANGLTDLKKLEIRLCDKVTDAGVKAVADKLTALTSLNLSWCQLVTDAGVKAVADKLTALTSLDLAGCDKVTDAGVKAVANNLAELTSLNLSKCNKVTDAGVKAVADKLTGLVYFDLRSIPSLGVPIEFLGNPNNPAAIRMYYTRGEKEGKRQLNEAKLIVVGNESVGKSALVNYLVSDIPCSDTGKTEGVTILDRINVAKWDVTAETTGEEPLRLNVWDFGGQEVLYETHKFFLTARSLYLVVLEARRENTVDAELELHNWMRAVRNRGGEEVPIIVVVNKAETPHELRLDEPRLRKEYPAIRAFIRTSCRDPKPFPEGGKGIAELRKLIVQTVQNQLPHVRDWFPTSYFRVKVEVGELTREESMLTTARYTTICNKVKVTAEAEQDVLLTLLDHIGVVVRHSDATLLDPNWLTTAVYRVLTHADVVKAGGEFSRDNLGGLLKDLKSADKYPEKWWPYIATMMVRFNLSFELPGQTGRYLVPLQLPTQEPEVNWDEEDSLRFRYDYDNLPQGLIPRFIVEMHRHLTPKRTAWVSGVVLAVDGCRVLVRADRKDRRVHIFVSGSPSQRRRGALAVVRTKFDVVHELHPDLTITAMVPVDVLGKPDAAVEYTQLIDSEVHGIEWITVGGSKFRVSDLLEGVGRENTKRPQIGKRDPLENPDFDTIGRPNLYIPSIGDILPLKPWWSSLVGPTVAALVTAGIAGMFLFGANPLVSGLLALAAVVFAVVYIIQMRFAWRSMNSPKLQSHLCVAAAVALSLLPSLKLFFEVTSFGKFEVVVDQAPTLTPAFLFSAVLFTGFQVYREQHDLHVKG